MAIQLRPLENKETQAASKCLHKKTVPSSYKGGPDRGTKLGEM